MTDAGEVNSVAAGDGLEDEVVVKDGRGEGDVDAARSALKQ